MEVVLQPMVDETVNPRFRLMSCALLGTEYVLYHHFSSTRVCDYLSSLCDATEGPIHDALPCHAKTKLNSKNPSIEARSTGQCGFLIVKQCPIVNA
jgi:hypothetical protein